MSIQLTNSNNKKFDLEDRTAKFGEMAIDFVSKLPQSAINKPLISQFVRSSTSIGANYMEANGADSKKDFHHKISLCKKESKESMHWSRMILIANPNLEDRCKILWQEARELALIFGAINKKKNLEN